MTLAAVLKNERFGSWAVLAALQAAVALALFHGFIFGDKYFAFLDVGSDTYHQYFPALVHMATPAAWQSAWSFNVGLGGVAPPSVGPFSLLAIAGGPDHVLALRIWVYLAKIFAGGAAFYGFALAVGARRESAVITAIAYSFCGFVMTDGQWDSLSTEFVAYALILWAAARHAAHPGTWMIPLSIAFAAYSGVFVFSVGVFLVYACAAACVASDRPAATAIKWMREIFPRAVAGLVLAAPAVLPAVYQLLESPRISGTQSAFGDRLRELLTLNDDTTILIELAGLFHKNLLGVGNRHFGWMNYLESPGFYVGLLPLLLVPQLWRGTRADRRILAAGAIALALFIFVPAIRYFAFGFGLDYFRVNNLWVSMLLLALFARSLEVIANQGIGRWLLAGTTVALALLLYHVHTGLFPPPSAAHELRIAALAAAALLLLALFAWHRIQWRLFALLALVFVASESALINYPSFNQGRDTVTRATTGYADATGDALAYINARDKGFYRIEKTYNSVSFCDSLVQGYFGVKSYWFHSAGVVGFFSELDLLPKRSRIKNFTNWLPNFGERFALYSLTGVKYIISRSPLGWPGFRQIHTAGGLAIYENELALPLGVVYEQQYPRDRLAKMSPEAKDITMINAAIVERLRGSAPSVYDARRLTRQGPAWIEENYAAPARILKQRGMAIETFSDGHIVGTVTSDVPGILAFSIPFARGWSVEIDGVEQPVFSANLGMLATEVSAGTHRVALRYSLPGFVPGLLAGLLGAVALGVVSLRARRLRPAAA